MQLSYTSLSALNKTKPPSKDPPVIKKPKIPFSPPTTQESKQEKLKEKEQKFQLIPNELSKTLDEKGISDKITAKKTCLADKIKVHI